MTVCSSDGRKGIRQGSRKAKGRRGGCSLQTLDSLSSKQTLSSKNGRKRLALFFVSIDGEQEEENEKEIRVSNMDATETRTALTVLGFDWGDANELVDPSDRNTK